MTAKISKLLVAALTALIAGFLYNYLDGRVPEPIPEQWKVKVMDAWMKTYGHTVWLLNYFNLIIFFSIYMIIRLSLITNCLYKTHMS